MTVNLKGYGNGEVVSLTYDTVAIGSPVTVNGNGVGSTTITIPDGTKGVHDR